MRPRHRIQGEDVMENIDKKKDHQAADTDASTDIDRAIDDLMGGLDDDIFELSDKADASQAPDDDEEAIDLFERANPDAPDDDDILELSDMVEAPPDARRGRRGYRSIRAHHPRHTG